jgi:hypothetical protein
MDRRARSLKTARLSPSLERGFLTLPCPLDKVNRQFQAPRPNENTNGLLRQYFPKGTDLSTHSAEDLEAVARTLNTRPRKSLNWRTPAEALDQHLR